MNFGWRSFLLMSMVHLTISAQIPQDPRWHISSAVKKAVGSRTLDSDLGLDSPSDIQAVRPTATNTRPIADSSLGGASLVPSSTAQNSTTENSTTLNNSTRIESATVLPLAVGSSTRILPGTSLIQIITNGTNRAENRVLEGSFSVVANGDLIYFSPVKSGPVNGTGFAIVQVFSLPTGIAIPVLPGTTNLIMLSNETAMLTGHGWDSSLALIVGQPASPSQRGPSRMSHDKTRWDPKEGPVVESSLDFDRLGWGFSQPRSRQSHGEENSEKWQSESGESTTQLPWPYPFGMSTGRAMSGSDMMRPGQGLALIPGMGIGINGMMGRIN